MWQVETLDAFDEWWQTLTEQEQDDTMAIRSAFFMRLTPNERLF